MKIEIRGIQFQNKGAELMLNAVVREVRRALPEAQLVVRERTGDYLDRARLGLYQKPLASEHPIKGFLLSRLLGSKLRTRFGVVLDGELDAVLDASGFAFSDQWGAGPTQRFANSVDRWRRAGTKVVLLPQAFGPFRDLQVAEAFRRIVGHVDLLYARDLDSYGYVVGLAGEHEHIRLAPDFTNILAGVPSQSFKVVGDRACVIPNSKMVEKVSDSGKGQYIPFLSRCIDSLRDAGLSPFVLVHSTKRDPDLCRSLQDHCSGELEVVEERDPLVIKWIIGQAFLVVGSRFHGLVSALSQGVPAIATGWSHKYQRLFEEYEIAEFVLADLEDQEEFEARLGRLVDPSSRSEVVSCLERVSAIQKGRTRQMWDEVLACLAHGSLPGPAAPSHAHGNLPLRIKSCAGSQLSTPTE